MFCQEFYYQSDWIGSFGLCVGPKLSISSELVLKDLMVSVELWDVNSCCVCKFMTLVVVCSMLFFCLILLRLRFLFFLLSIGEWFSLIRSFVFLFLFFCCCFLGFFNLLFLGLQMGGVCDPVRSIMFFFPNFPMISPHKNVKPGRTSLSNCNSVLGKEFLRYSMILVTLCRHN